MSANRAIPHPAWLLAVTLLAALVVVLASNGFAAGKTPVGSCRPSKRITARSTSCASG